MKRDSTESVCASICGFLERAMARGDCLENSTRCLGIHRGLSRVMKESATDLRLCLEHVFLVVFNECFDGFSLIARYSPKKLLAQTRLDQHRLQIV